MTRTTPKGRIDHAGICTAYEQLPRTVDSWVRLLNFPARGDDGLWNAKQVDIWVKGNRPQAWPAKAAATGKATAPAAPAESTEQQADAGEELLGPSGLAARYKVTPQAVNAWKSAAGFPDSTESGKWRVSEVDAWVSKNRAHVWAEFTGAGPLVVVAPPQGDPKDLYDLAGYGAILGNATRGKPLSPTTISGYKARGLLEPPDRKPGDRKKPEVFEPMWYLETIKRHVYGRRGPGRAREGRTRRPRQ
ncbi:MAG: hypothetical protein JO362_04130 [Streptomycetaceae bacterium]|nr:hypothetical protein [Streptomycetaceae bacterium]